MLAIYVHEPRQRPLAGFAAQSFDLGRIGITVRDVRFSYAQARSLGLSPLGARAFVLGRLIQG